MPFSGPAETIQQRIVKQGQPCMAELTDILRGAYALPISLFCGHRFSWPEPLQ